MRNLVSGLEDSFIRSNTTVNARGEVYELRTSLPSPGLGRLPCSQEDGAVAGCPGRSSPDPPGWAPQGDSHHPGLGAWGWTEQGCWSTPGFTQKHVSSFCLFKKFLKLEYNCFKMLC